MFKQVRVVIGGTPQGHTEIVPYSRADGAQYYVVGGVRTDQLVAYSVPFYEVRVENGGTYHAVRFGLQNKGTTPQTRTCDAGLAHERLCTPTWVDGYRPHSFAGTHRAGAFRLIPKKQFLIHEGADSGQGQIGGSLGCIEVLDGGWNLFLAEIEILGLGAINRLANAGKVRVKIESAVFPQAVRV